MSAESVPDPPATDVATSRHGAVALLRLDRPQARNAVGGTLFRDLLAALEAADLDEDVRAVVTTGAGSTFCVGADLAELGRLLDGGPIDLGAIGVDGIGGPKGLPPASPRQRRADHLGIGRWSRRVLDVGVPTVAAVNGVAAGGGLALALLHDVRIAARDARLATGMVSVGLAPEMGMSWLLPRMVGASRAFGLLTRTRPIEADEAREIGLVDEVVEPGELQEAALARAAELARLPPTAVRVAKRLLRESWDATLEQQLEREWTTQASLFAGEEATAAMRAVRARVGSRHAAGGASGPAAASEASSAATSSAE